MGPNLEGFWKIAADFVSDIFFKKKKKRRIIKSANLALKEKEENHFGLNANCYKACFRKGKAGGSESQNNRFIVWSRRN